MQDTWRQDTEVIYPPVDVTEIQAVEDWSARLNDQELVVLRSLPDGYLLGASRLVPYKRLDLVIRAGEASRRPVVIAGSGPEEDALRTLARHADVDVRFVDSPSNSLLRALYQRAFAFVFPAVEDFGIMPVEAMALGTPVIGRNLGGVSETVADGVTGVLVDDWSSPELASLIRRLDELDKTTIRAHSVNFSKEKFVAHLHSWMSDSLR
ncbi:glycosyltransferase [Agreia sp. PsM10]|uniref:glycosyltransferase n=1 Tax=Agreia sp. PsM10 TaxID=3030533 RepID=UPI00263BA58C|nr:glycosyltransferase [Agreia sp. PsM10]MDN4641987.1 glycosyltransferase [Agreia sp. PsM10]